MLMLNTTKRADVFSISWFLRWWTFLAALSAVSQTFRDIATSVSPKARHFFESPNAAYAEQGTLPTPQDDNLLLILLTNFVKHIEDNPAYKFIAILVNLVSGISLLCALITTLLNILSAG